MSVRCYAIGCANCFSETLLHGHSSLISGVFARQGLWLRVLCFIATIKGPNNVKCTEFIISY